jgi:hypothetical protein
MTVTLGTILLLACASTSIAEPQSASFDAFRKAATVLRHPRCLNCHVPGEAPLVGSSGEAHAMGVRRGVDGLGTPLLRCSSCHQESNVDAMHAPPGAPGWQLPASRARLAWVGLDDVRLCHAILDSQQNGGMHREAIVTHMMTDARVLWAWAPGPGRAAPPMDHRTFVELIRTWIERGADCGR